MYVEAASTANYGFAGLFLVIGVLIGVMFTVLAYGLARGAPQRRVRRAARRLAAAQREAARAAAAATSAPLPNLWATGQPTRRRVPGQGGIDDFRQGKRVRPEYNPNPGPRDW